MTHSFFLFMTAVLSFMLSACDAQIKNAHTQTFKVYGNCGMCKKTIEKAANQKGLVKASWNEDTKMLSVTYDNVKTTPEEVLKRVAEAGYDNEKFLAPDEAYANLHGCCQYERQGTSPDSSKVH